MNIIVCIKQVPACFDVKINSKTNCIIREGQSLETNTFDLYALEEAISIVEKVGGTVTVISMGTPSAADMLKDSIAMGADHVILLSDKVFAGADTLATSYTLSKAIEKIGNYDLIICGRQSSDGDTAQVGPSLAAKLNIPHTTNVINIESLYKDSITCKRLTEGGYQVVEMDMPALITVSKGINEPRIASLRGMLRAKKSEIQIWTSSDLDCNVELCGFKGSATKVVKTYVPKYDLKSETITGSPGEQASKIFNIIMDKLPNIDKHDYRYSHSRAKRSLSKFRNDGHSCYYKENDSETIRDCGIWILCEQRNGRILNVVFELIGKARELSLKNKSKVSVVLLGNYKEKEIQYLSYHGPDNIFIVKNDALDDINDELYSEIFAKLIKKYNPSIVLMGATVFGRSIAPRIASNLNTGITADCTGLDIDTDGEILLQTRPTFGGSLMATVICQKARPQMATVRPKVMKSIELNFRNNVSIIHEQIELPSVRTRIKKIISDIHDKISLDEAEIVVAGGRGIRGEKGFQMLYEFAELIGGTVGASRAAVDAGWIQYSRQIGQSGITIRPEIYFACGISGAVQHIVGMSSCGLIISINNDPKAPIFNYSNYNIIGDVFEILPLLIDEFKRSKL